MMGLVDDHDIPILGGHQTTIGLAAHFVIRRQYAIVGTPSIVAQRLKVLVIGCGYADPELARQLAPPLLHQR